MISIQYQILKKNLEFFKEKDWSESINYNKIISLIFILIMPFWRKKIYQNMKWRMNLWNFNNRLTRQWYIDISTWIWMQYLQNNTPATVSGCYLICITWRQENEVHRVNYRIIIPTFICLEHRQVSPWWLTGGGAEIGF